MEKGGFEPVEEVDESADVPSAVLLHRDRQMAEAAADLQRPFGTDHRQHRFEATVGGAGGPLYSTIFMEAGKVIGPKMEIGLADWYTALQAAATGVANRGKALPNDKTMLDALYPAVDALKRAVDENLPIPEALQVSAEAAHAGMLATIPLVAHKGRASYLGERSAGHQDPGATSTFLLLDTAAKAWADC